jgi:hypothetical protein
MKRQKSCGPRLGKLVHQLPGVVTFAYDLRFRRVIARWKGIIEEIHFGGSIMPLNIIEDLYPEKPSFRPSKWPRKLKLLKIVNCQNCQKTVLSQLEKVGGHRYPSGSYICEVWKCDFHGILHLSFFPDSIWACLCCFFVLFFPPRFCPVGDVLDQHLLFVEALFLTHCFIRFSRYFNIRVWNPILGPTTLPYFPLRCYQCFLLNPCWVD